MRNIGSGDGGNIFGDTLCQETQLITSHTGIQELVHSMYENTNCTHNDLEQW